MHQQKFLIQLHEILNDSKYSDCICWDETGESIEIKDKTKFSKTVCKNYFKHKNYLSFVRQLNLYNFIKVKKNNEKSKIIKYKHKDSKFVKTTTLEEIKLIKKKDEQNQDSSKQNNTLFFINKLYMKKYLFIFYSII